MRSQTGHVCVYSRRAAACPVCARQAAYLPSESELIPEKLIIYLVVELHLGSFYDCPQEPGAPIRGSLLQIRKPALDVSAEQLGGPIGFLKVLKRGVDIVRQVSLRA